MNTPKAAGFTIIETMLFLAVSGMLIIGLLVGTGTSINIQRYRDSVLSLQTVLQDQYSQVANVSNQLPPQALSCDSAASVSVDPSSTTSRGQSDCVILGRYVRTLNNTTLELSTVVGRAPIAASAASNDITALQQFAIAPLPESVGTQAIEWNAAIQRAGSTADASFSLLILRSPLSGVVRTFINPTESVSGGNIGSLVGATSLTNDLKICVDAGGLFGVKRMAVNVTKNATGPSGVETLGDASSGC